jgi:Leucine-rich repeat (LRR) protein
MDITRLSGTGTPSTSSANTGGNGGSATTPAHTISHTNAWTQAPGTVAWRNTPPDTHWAVMVGQKEAKLTPASDALLSDEARTTSPHGTSVTVQVRQLPDDSQNCEARITVGGTELSIDTTAFKERYGKSFMDFIAAHRPTSQPQFVGPSLPVEMWGMIADNASFAGLANLRQISKTTLNAANSRVFVHLTDQSQFDQFARSLKPGQFSGLDGINKISLSGAWVTDQTVQALGTLLRNRASISASITQLDLSNCPNITGSSLANVATNLGHLTHLNLSKCSQFTSPDLQLLQSLTHLEHLDMSECALDDNVFQNFAPLQNGTQPFSQLTHLSLSRCTQITKPDNLRGLTKLEHLNFDECERLTSIEELQHLGNLKSLSLQHCKQLDTQCIGHIGNAGNLTHLNLAHCMLSRSHFAGFGNLRNLEFLDLSSSDIPTSVMAHIGSLTRLTELHLKFANVASADLNHLQGLANCLKKLDLMQCGDFTADATGVPVLQSLTKLTSLGLSDCIYLDATDLPRVAHLTNLRHLDLAGCREVTDDTLQQYVQPLPNLRSLRIDWCENITATSIAHLLDPNNYKKLKTLNIAETGILADRISELERRIENVISQIVYAGSTG